MSYRAQASNTPDLYLVCSCAQVVQPPDLLTGGVVVVVVVVVAVPGVRWDV